MRAIHSIQVAGALLAVAACSDNAGPSTPTHLAFEVQPSDAGIGDSFAPAVVVTVKDDAERTVWSWTDTVRLSLATGGDSAALAGITSVAPVTGTAVFEDLRITGPGAAHRLVATSGGLTEGTSQPIAVHGLFTAASVAAGGYHTCALAADGTAFCWGANYYGQLGDGTLTQRPYPTPVATSLRFATISVGAWHSCGLTSEGAAYCWGSNYTGILGDGTVSTSAVTPQKVAFGTPFVALDAGFWHTCGLTAGGQAYCWGANVWGQLGDGSDSTRNSPAQVAGGMTFAAISAGFFHTCGLTAGGAAYCWGSDIYGELGDGFINRVGAGAARLTATQVVGGHQFTSLTAGGGSCHGKTCGIATDGTTWCWGRSYQTLQLDSIPTALTGGQAFARMAIGGTAVCGVTTGGALYCWGQGFDGVVGNGTTDWVRTPARIAEGQAFALVSMGQQHSCAVSAEGTVYCWGSNRQGQLGGSPGAAGWSVPVPVWKP